jgi:hypothetical protein
VNDPASSLHWKDVYGLSANVNDGEVVALVAAGFALMVGAADCTVHVYVAAELALPAESTAMTPKLCRPCASPESAWGDEQTDAVAPSSEQRNVTPGSASVKLNDGAVVALVAAGDAVIVGTGGGSVSTEKVIEELVPTFPRSSDCCATMVYVPSASVPEATDQAPPEAVAFSDSTTEPPVPAPA